MTTSPQRNAAFTKFVVPACGERIEKMGVRTGNQCERQSKETGRRTTNDRKHRKGSPRVIAGRLGYLGVDEPLFDGRSLISVAKSMGICSHRPDGVKGGGMSRRLGECNWGAPPQFAPCGAITQRISHGAESARGRRGWESESAIVVRMHADNTTAAERRADRLRTRSAPRGGRV